LPPHSGKKPEIRSQVSAFVDGLFNVNLDILTFKVHLRDFLISLKEFSVDDNQGLFQEEQDERLDGTRS